jgi:hypothetical protein
MDPRGLDCSLRPVVSSSFMSKPTETEKEKTPWLGALMAKSGAVDPVKLV